MGTRATIKLQLEVGDALRLYTNYDGYSEQILQWSSGINERWTQAVRIIAERIHEQADIYPLLNEWVSETSLFLNSPASLQKYGNMLINQGLGGLHLNQSMPLLSTIPRPLYASEHCDADFHLNINTDSSVNVKRRAIKKLRTISDDSLPNTLSFQFGHRDPENRSESTYQTLRANVHDVFYDIAQIPRFFRELYALLCSDNKYKNSSFSKEDGTSEILKDFIRSLSRFSPYQHSGFKNSLEFSGMLENVHASIPLGQHETMIGQHLSLLKPNHYFPSSIASLVNAPKHLLTFQTIDNRLAYYEVKSPIHSDAELLNYFQTSTHSIPEEAFGCMQLPDISHLYETSSSARPPVVSPTSLLIPHVAHIAQHMHSILTNESQLLNIIERHRLLKDIKIPSNKLPSNHAL